MTSGSEGAPYAVGAPPRALVVARVAGPAGVALLPFHWPGGVPSGASFWSPWWLADAGGPAGFLASNGVRGTTP